MTSARDEEHPVVIHGYFVPDERSSRRTLEFPDVIALVRQRWRVFAACIVLVSVLSIAYSQLSHPRYRASAIVSIVENDLSLSLPGQLGGLASIAGLRLPGGGEQGHGIAFLRSRMLARTFIAAEGIVDPLTPDPETPGEERLARAVRFFTEDVCEIKEDGLTGIITVTIRWKDPEQAAAWANGLVKLADAEMRKRAIGEASRAVEYLSAEADRTENLELRQAVYRVVQSQLQLSALASARDEHSYRLIDPARAPLADDYVWPRLVVLLPLGVVVGTLLAGAIVLFKPDSRTSA